MQRTLQIGSPGQSLQMQWTHIFDTLAGNGPSSSEFTGTIPDAYARVCVMPGSEPNTWTVTTQRPDATG